MNDKVKNKVKICQFYMAGGKCGFGKAHPQIVPHLAPLREMTDQVSVNCHFTQVKIEMGLGPLSPFVNLELHI